MDYRAGNATTFFYWKIFEIQVDVVTVFGHCKNKKYAENV